MTLVLLTLALGLGTFTQVFDLSIANVSIPAIAGDLGVSPEQGAWAITSFAVSSSVVLPLTGWLSRRFGEVKLFSWSIALFAFTSWLCGLAWNFPLLVCGRTLQGAVGGVLIPLSQSLLLQHYPPDKKGLALGLWGMIVVVAPILGPILGGWITDNYGWPWIFYINIPIGLLSAFLTYELLKDRDAPRQKVPLDLIGLALLIIGVGSLQILLDKGNGLDWFTSPVIGFLGVLAAIGISLFIVWNYYSKYPVMDFSFFRDRNFVFGTLIATIAFMLFFSGTILLPLWLQTQMGYTAYLAGLALAPIGIIPLFLSAPIGKFMHHMDLRKLAAFSFVMFAVAFYWFSGFNTQVSLSQLVYARLFQGLGVSLYFIPLVTIALSNIPNHQLSSASGVFTFIRLLVGAGFGTAISVTLWSRREIHHHSQLVEALQPHSTAYDTTIETLNAAGIQGPAAARFLDNLITQQASLLSLNDIFMGCGIIFLFLVPILFLCKRVAKREGAAVISE